MGEPLGVVGSPSLPPPGRRALAHVFSVEKKVIADDDIGDSSVGGLPRVESTSAVEFEGIEPGTAATGNQLNKQGKAALEAILTSGDLATDASCAAGWRGHAMTTTTGPVTTATLAGCKIK